MLPDFLGRLFANFQDLLRRAKDEHFQEFFANPKVQALMKDQEFQRVVQDKNVFKLMTNQEFTEILKDPEIRSTLEEIHKKFDKPA